MSDFLQIQFCQQMAVIDCPDEELRAALANYFRYQLVTSAHPARVVYRIIPPHAPTASWQIQRDASISFTTSERGYVFAYLIYEVVAYLVNHSPDYLVLHAAGLAHNESGVIFCAASGSGKSTLTAWLVAAGWGFYTDEMVAISRLEGHMHGLTIPIVLQKTTMLENQPWFAPQEWPYKSAEVTWLDPLTIRPHTLPAPTLPRYLIFPHYTPQNPLQVQPLSAAAAAFRMWPRIINPHNWPDKGLTLAKQLAQRLPAYQVNYANLNELTAWLESLLTPLQ